MSLSVSLLKSEFNLQFVGLTNDYVDVAVKWADAYIAYASNAETIHIPAKSLDAVPGGTETALLDDVLFIVTTPAPPYSEAQRSAIAAAKDPTTLANHYVDSIVAFWTGDGILTFPLTFGGASDMIDPAGSFLTKTDFVTRFEDLFSDPRNWVSEYTPDERSDEYFSIIHDLTLTAKTFIGFVQ